MIPLRQGFGAQAPLHPVDPSSDLPAEALAKAGALKARRRITAIPPDHLGSLWRDVWPLLERAATRTNGGTEEEVARLLLLGEAQLWGVFDGDRLVAAVTTQITLSGEKGCRLWLVGGSGMAEWAADLLASVEPWARSLGCTHVWGAQSRAGWRRIVRLFGGAPVIIDGKASWMRRI